MTLIPHSLIFLREIRVNDLWLLLGTGAVWELGCRVFVMMVKRKPRSLTMKEGQLKQLQHETKQKRNLGPSAFVETSKLERQVLAHEKQLETMHSQRKTQLARIEKQLIRNGNLQVALLIFVLYYGVAVVSIDSGSSFSGDIIMNESYDDNNSAGASFTKQMLFPLSYIGMGVRISKWGLADAESSIGALVVLWSAQVTVGKLMDAVEAIYLSP